MSGDDKIALALKTCMAAMQGADAIGTFVLAVTTEGEVRVSHGAAHADLHEFMSGLCDVVQKYVLEITTSQKRSTPDGETLQ